jgi:hypothetical protein
MNAILYSNRCAGGLGKSGEDGGSFVGEAAPGPLNLPAKSDQSSRKEPEPRHGNLLDPLEQPPSGDTQRHINIAHSDKAKVVEAYYIFTVTTY